MSEKKQNFKLQWLTVFFCIMTLGGFAYTEVATAAVPDIKIALVYPLSGALSRNGNLTMQSIKASMAWVNENGGIKSLGVPN